MAVKKNDKIIVKFDLNKEYDKFESMKDLVSIDDIKSSFTNWYRKLSKYGTFFVYVPDFTAQTIALQLMAKYDNVIGPAKIISEENNVFTLEVEVTGNLAYLNALEGDYKSTARWLGPPAKFILLSIA